MKRIAQWLDRGSRDIRMTAYAGIIFWMAFSAFAGMMTGLFYPDFMGGEEQGGTHSYDYLIEDCH